MDADLALALELSAAAARGRANAPLLLPLIDGPPLPRVELGAPLEHHFGKSRGGRVASGRIISRGALDQFAPHWTAMIDRHGVAGSICGYVTAANVECLCRCVASLPPIPANNTFLPEQQLDALLGAVRDELRVMPLVEANMQRVSASRRRYVEQHPEGFPGGASGQAATDFFKQWVANFELSDLLAGDALKAGAGKGPGEESASGSWKEGEQLGGTTTTTTTTTTTNSSSRRHFLRYNQFPEKDHATPDEKVRIVADEARFGGRLNPDGTSTYAAGDSVFIVERFGGGDAEAAAGAAEAAGAEAATSHSARALLSPEEWAAAEAAEAAAAAAVAVRVFAIDLNGHYSAGFACRVGPHGTNTLVLVNSTETAYADRPSMVWLYDMLFPPTAENVADVAAASGDAAIPDSLVLELVAMGFEEPAARAALGKANGSTAVAVDILLQQGT